MNLFGLGNVGSGVVFKMAAKEGATVFDYQIIRNVALIFFAVIELCCI